MKTLLKNRELSAFFAIVALFVVLVALNPAYFSLQTLAMIFASSQILCLLALGATLVMLTRNIDVSGRFDRWAVRHRRRRGAELRLRAGDGYRLRAGDWRAGRSF